MTAVSAARTCTIAFFKSIRFAILAAGNPWSMRFANSQRDLINSDTRIERCWAVAGNLDCADPHISGCFCLAERASHVIPQGDTTPPQHQNIKTPSPQLDAQQQNSVVAPQPIARRISPPGTREKSPLSPTFATKVGHECKNSNWRSWTAYAISNASVLVCISGQSCDSAVTRNPCA